MKSISLISLAIDRCQRAITVPRRIALCASLAIAMALSIVSVAAAIEGPPVETPPTTTHSSAFTPTQQQAYVPPASDIYPSLSTIELQTCNTWMQLVTNHVANQMQIGDLAEAGIVDSRSLEAPVISGPSEDEIFTVSYNAAAYNQSTAEQQTDDRPISSSLMTFKRRYRPAWTGWGQGYGLGGTLASNGAAGGLTYGLGGGVFGVDRWCGRKTLVGLMGGYSGSNVGEPFTNSSTAINGYQVGWYGLHRFQRCYAIGGTAYSGDNYTTNRTVSSPGSSATAHSSYAGNLFVKYVELGTTFSRGRVSLQPLAAVQYIYLNQHAFSETGAGAANMVVNREVTDSVRSMLGARMFNEYHWGRRRWVPMIQGRWQHEWGDGTRLITSSFSGTPNVAFNVTGNTLGRDFGLFTVGTNLITSPRTSFWTAYDLQVASRYAANMGSAGMQYRW